MLKIYIYIQYGTMLLIRSPRELCNFTYSSSGKEVKNVLPIRNQASVSLQENIW